VAPDLPENVTEARRWLTSEAPVAVERRQGDKTTYRVACELHDRGISETLAFDMMTDGWNARCDPPWQHDDLETKVRNAYRYADNDFGCKSSRSAGQAAFGHVKLPETGEPTRLDWDWWLSRPLTPPEPMLGHFITTGAFLFIGGPTGEGKTQLAMAIAGALVTNTKLMHWQCHGVRRVLIIDGEMPNALTQQRLRDLHRRLGSPRGAPLHLLARDDFPAMKPLNTEAGREFIMRKIEEIRPDLIVFDSRMCLTLGELRDEKTWASTLPLVLEIRHRKIAQIWIDHMGLIADHLYGDKTKEWTADIVALMLAMSKEDKLRAGSTVHFRLEIAKARTRTPDIGDDFRDGIVTLKDDAWSFTADGDKPAGKVPKWCQSFYKALLTVLGDGHNITAPTWQAECERRNFIPSPPEEETYAQRSTRLSTFRAAKSRLAQIGAIDMFGDFVHCAKTWR
jgi:energy-coupling factor transporter ATP-binding protein EcfA2